jgi:hypothetical protein
MRFTIMGLVGHPQDRIEPFARHPGSGFHTVNALVAEPRTYGADLTYRF